MVSSLGANIGGGTEEARDQEKSKLDTVAQAQDSSSQLTQRLAGLVQDQRTTIAAVERGRAPPHRTLLLCEAQMIALKYFSCNV